MTHIDSPRHIHKRGFYRRRPGEPLRNLGHERFCHGLAEKKSLLDAYKDAGYAPEPGNAKRARNRRDVQERLHELLNEAAEFLNLRKVRVVLEIDRVGRANFADFYEPEIGPDRKPTGRDILRRISSLPRELSAAIAEVEFGDDGRPTKIKLHDKNQANFTLMKIMGGLPEPAPASANVSIFNILSPEDQRVLAGALESIGGGPDSGSDAATSEREPA